MWSPRSGPAGVGDEGGEVLLHRRRTSRRGRRAAAVRRRCRSGPRGPDRRRPDGGAGWRRPGRRGCARRPSSIASPCGPCSSQRSRMPTIDRDLGVDALLRLVDPVQRLLERRCPLEVVDAVVAERPAQGGQERRRQPLPFDVERPEVGVEVLLRGAHLHVGVGLVAHAAVQHPQVGEGDEHVVLGVGELGIAAERAPRRGQVGGRRPGVAPPRCRSRASGRAAAPRSRRHRALASGVVGSGRPARRGGRPGARRRDPVRWHRAGPGRRRCRPARSGRRAGAGHARRTAPAPPSPSSCSR